MARRHEEQPVVIIEKSGGGIGAFLSGLAFGAGLALLLAPQSGEETREYLRGGARRLRESAEDKFDDLQDAVETGYEKTKANIEAGFVKARRRLDEQRTGAREAVHAGKAAVRSARDELERRLADARAKRGAPTDDAAAE